MFRHLFSPSTTSLLILSATDCHLLESNPLQKKQWLTHRCADIQEAIQRLKSSPPLNPFRLLILPTDEESICETWANLNEKTHAMRVMARARFHFGESSLGWLALPQTCTPPRLAVIRSAQEQTYLLHHLGHDPKLAQQLTALADANCLPAGIFTASQALSPKPSTTNHLMIVYTRFGQKLLESCFYQNQLIHSRLFTHPEHQPLPASLISTLRQQLQLEQRLPTLISDAAIQVYLPSSTPAPYIEGEKIRYQASSLIDPGWQTHAEQIANLTLSQSYFSPLLPCRRPPSQTKKIAWPLAALFCLSGIFPWVSHRALPVAPEQRLDQLTLVKQFHQARTQQATRSPSKFFHALSEILEAVPALELKSVRWQNPINAQPSMIIEFEPSPALPSETEKTVIHILTRHGLVALTPWRRGEALHLSETP